MRSKNILVSLVAVLSLVFLLTGNASADVYFNSVEVEGVRVVSGADLSSYAGQTVPVQITFSTNTDENDTRVKAEISGSSGSSYISERFDLIAGKTYTRYFNLVMPTNIDPSERVLLEISIENRDEVLSRRDIPLTVQRESYDVQVLDVNMNDRVQAGKQLALDIVLKNTGRHLAEDTFVKAKIPSLGIEQKAYFGDLSAVDQADPDKEDASERKMIVSIPSNAKPGIYTIEIEAYNADTTTTTSKKFVVVGASEDSIVVSPAKSKTFAVGESVEYSLTLVNSGDKVKVYEVVLNAPTGLTVEADESLVAIPAGTSKTVKLKAIASKTGVYDFTATVQSSGDLVSKESFIANIEGSKSTTSIAGSTTVLLTVVLAIIFVVLLVVLIVLMTRKPEKTREFGESYY